MTRSNMGTRRRTVLFAGLAVVASTGLLLAGCGSGQVSSTADMAPAVDGINTDVQAPNGGGSYKVRNLTVDFELDGYASGSDARLAVALYNDTGEPVTVRVTSDGADAVRLVNPNETPPPPPPTTAAATPTESASPGATASESPTAAPTSAAPPGGPASFTIPPAGYVLLNRESGTYLLLTGLKQDLNEGDSVPVVFDFGGQQVTTNAGLAVPLTAIPRGKPVVPGEENEGDLAPNED